MLVPILRQLNPVYIPMIYVLILFYRLRPGPFSVLIEIKIFDLDVLLVLFLFSAVKQTLNTLVERSL
jgi:hypothetical protein